jgi:hypothetical protein
MAKKPIVWQSVGIPSPHEPTNPRTPFIGREKNSQNLYKPLQKNSTSTKKQHPREI